LLIDWPGWWLRLAIAHLDALTRAQEPTRPYRNQFHEGDGARILALRERYEAGAWSGPTDRRDPEALELPAAPFPRPPAIPLPAPTVVGYCRACGAAMATDGDWCERCGGAPR
jgi:hypothetical protein